MSRFCEKCGNQLSPDSSFCEECGTPVSGEEVSLPSSPTKKPVSVTLPPPAELKRTKIPSLYIAGALGIMIILVFLLVVPGMISKGPENMGIQTVSVQPTAKGTGNVTPLPVTTTTISSVSPPSPENTIVRTPEPVITQRTVPGNTVNPASDSRSAGDWIVIANNRDRSGDKNGALQAFEYAIKNDPHDSLAYFRIAEVSDELGQYEKSLDALETVLSINPTYSNAWNLKGIIYEKQGEEKKASAAYEKISYYNRPNNVAAYYLEQIGSYPEALQKYDRILSYGDDYAFNWYKK
jgi:hypothetical protein